MQARGSHSRWREINYKHDIGRSATRGGCAALGHDGIEIAQAAVLNFLGDRTNFRKLGTEPDQIVFRGSESGLDLTMAH
jgi:hypothetical protein